jgi:hypothetical protein
MQAFYDLAALGTSLYRQPQFCSLPGKDRRHWQKGGFQVSCGVSARVAELAYALDLGSSPERGRGSTPLPRTIS